MEMVDVAPTIASILGFEMRNVDGRPAEGIFE
jgi:hypothetical protein